MNKRKRHRLRRGQQQADKVRLAPNLRTWKGEYGEALVEYKNGEYTAYGVGCYPPYEPSRVQRDFDPVIDIKITPQEYKERVLGFIKAKKAGER
jgi:hypothetical protein